METIFWILLTVLTAGYMLPTSVAGLRNDPDLPIVFLINFMFGWTIIGWIFALWLAF